MTEQKNDSLLVIEAALFTSNEPLSADKLTLLFDESERPSISEIRSMIDSLREVYVDRALELVEVASGYRFQAKATYAESLQRLSEKKTQRYSRSLMETLALIAYRQPITRGEIEEVRGVAVSSQTIRTLMDRDWIKVAGHRDVPGKPAMFATTKEFLDYFNLKKLSDLPELSELVDFESLEKQLGLQFPSEKKEEDASAMDEQDVVIENEVEAVEEAETV